MKGIAFQTSEQKQLFKLLAEPPVRFLRHCLSAVLALGVNLGLVGAAVAAQANEPYSMWRYYFNEWFGALITCSAYLVAICSIVLLIAACIPNLALRSGLLRVPGLNRLWWAIPPVLLWSLAYFVATPVTDRNFGFTSSETQADLELLTDVSVIASGWFGSIVVAGVSISLAITGWKRESRRIALLYGNCCPDCRYSLLGTPNHCPECGWRRASA